MSRAKRKRINAMRRKREARRVAKLMGFLTSPPVVEALNRYAFEVAQSFVQLAAETNG